MRKRSDPRQMVAAALLVIGAIVGAGLLIVGHLLYRHIAGGWQ